MPPEDNLPAKTKGVSNPKFRGVMSPRQTSNKLSKKDLQGIFERTDIEVEVHRGKLVIRRKADNRLLRLVKSSLGIQLVEPPKVRKPEFLPGIITTPVEMPELGGLRRAKPAPRETQPAGTAPHPPKAKPDKKKWPWSGK
jgi:hypothetical protein